MEATMLRKLFRKSRSLFATQRVPVDAIESALAGDLAIVLTGGGARAAYQVGVLRALARKLPNARFPIITGVSAGAINASFLAAHPGSLKDAMDDLTELWSGLDIDRIFNVEAGSLLRNGTRWVLRLGTGGNRLAPKVRGLVDTSPLQELLVERLTNPDQPGNMAIPGIADNIESGRLKAIALTTINYGTGQTLTWFEGADIATWERPERRSRKVRLTVDHVMASAALPLIFPAVHLEGAWHGDGGIRLSAPLSPAVHLGANRILVISTRHRANHQEAAISDIKQYPPPAQILGKLLNSVFLDLVDQDVARLERINRLIERVPPEEREEFRPIDALVIRPSENLGALAAQYEVKLPWAFRFLTRGLGTRETKSPDFLAMLMFNPDYLRHLIEVGEKDAEARMDELVKLVQAPVLTPEAARRASAP
jgi:NTE family protein